jgi:uncharacterized coiled-coil protein SlyX
MKSIAMNYVLEKEIARLNALLAIQDDVIMHLREKLLEDRADEARRLAEAWSENARLHYEIEQLRTQVADLESAHGASRNARQAAGAA